MASTEKANPTPNPAAGAHAAAVKPLETLPSMLHAVMIQTAGVFSSPDKHNPRALMHTNALVKHSIHGANDRFQYALDLLEIDILKAKAALGGDLQKYRHAVELARQQEEAAVAAAKALADKAEQDRIAKLKEESERAELEKKRKEEEEKERIRLEKEKEEEMARKQKEEEERERERKEREAKEDLERKEREAAEEEKRKKDEEEAATKAAMEASAAAAAATSNDPIILDTPPQVTEMAPDGDQQPPPDAAPEMLPELSAGLDLFGEGPMDAVKADGSGGGDIDMSMGDHNIDMDLLFGTDLDDPPSMDTSGMPHDQADNQTAGGDVPLDFKLEDVDMGLDLPPELANPPPAPADASTSEQQLTGVPPASAPAQDEGIPAVEGQDNANENNFEDLLAGLDDGSMFNENFGDIYNFD